MRSFLRRLAARVALLSACSMVGVVPSVSLAQPCSDERWVCIAPSVSAVATDQTGIHFDPQRGGFILLRTHDLARTFLLEDGAWVPLALETPSFARIVAMTYNTVLGKMQALVTNNSSDSQLHLLTLEATGWSSTLLGGSLFDVRAFAVDPGTGEAVAAGCGVNRVCGFWRYDVTLREWMRLPDPIDNVADLGLNFGFLAVDPVRNELILAGKSVFALRGGRWQRLDVGAGEGPLQTSCVWYSVIRGTYLLAHQHDISEFNPATLRWSRLRERSDGSVSVIIADPQTDNPLLIQESYPGHTAFVGKLLRDRYMSVVNFASPERPLASNQIVYHERLNEVWLMSANLLTRWDGKTWRVTGAANFPEGTTLTYDGRRQQCIVADTQCKLSGADYVFAISENGEISFPFGDVRFLGHFSSFPFVDALRDRFYRVAGVYDCDLAYDNLWQSRTGNSDFFSVLDDGDRESYAGYDPVAREAFAVRVDGDTSKVKSMRLGFSSAFRETATVRIPLFQDLFYHNSTYDFARGTVLLNLPSQGIFEFTQGTLAYVKAAPPGVLQIVYNEEAGRLQMYAEEHDSPNGLMPRGLYEFGPAGGPEILSPPLNRHVTPGVDVVFRASQIRSSVGGNITLRWLKDGAALVPTSRVLGVGTAELTLKDVGYADGGQYALAATDSCGTRRSVAAELTLPCPADFNLDGGVDGNDVLAFFHYFALGESDADTNFDGGVDGADVETFFTAWQRGGCG